MLDNQIIIFICQRNFFMFTKPPVKMINGNDKKKQIDDFLKIKIELSYG